MKELDKFGVMISEDLRDSALNRYLDIESGHIASPKAKRLHELLNGLSDNQKEIVRKLISDSIDSGIHDFLFALQEKEGTEITINGKNVSSMSDGLNGEIFGEDGWFEKFSQHGESGI